MTIIHGLNHVPTSATVAIAGGGPSGTYLALRLAAAGIDSVVIEPRTEVDRLRPRAKTTNARTMTLLAGLDIDGTTLAEAVRETAALPVSYSQDVIFCTGLNGYELRRFHGAFQLVDGRYDIQPECGQQIPQPDVEQVLRNAADASELITFVTGTRALRADTGPTRLSVTSADETADDEVHTIEARWIIGADGGTSRVRRSLGIGLQGTSAPRPNFNVVFTSANLREHVTIDPAVQWWIVNEKISGMIGELDRDGTWWAILQGCEAIADPAEVAATIRTMTGVGAEVDINVLATDSWTARMLLADSYGGAESNGSVFLVGDAAHLNPPWGGHGFNTCISDAENLAWKLIAVHEGWADPALLASFEEERRPVAARMIADAAVNGKSLAYDFVDPILRETGAEADAARVRVHEALAVKMSEFHSEGLVLGYEYAGTSRVQAGPVPFVDAIEYRGQALPGCLLPHFWREDGASIYPDFAGFTVFALPEETAAGRAVPDDVAVRQTDAAIAEVEAIARAQSVPLQVIRLTGPDARKALDLWGDAMLLVRPDHHIAAIVPSPRGLTTTTTEARAESCTTGGILGTALRIATAHASVGARESEDS